MSRLITYWTMAAAICGFLGLLATIVWRHALKQMQPDTPEPKAERFDAAAGEAWVRDVVAIVARLAEDGMDVSTDDVWRICPPPAGVDGRLVSRVFDRSEWEIVDYRLSARGRNAARKIAVWRKKTSQAEAA